MAGGIGKSTLAAALARDPAVPTHFSDGTLWVTLGSNLMYSPTKYLDQAWATITTSYHRRRCDTSPAHTLERQAALLVIDDAWQAEHVRYLWWATLVAGC